MHIRKLSPPSQRLGESSHFDRINIEQFGFAYIKDSFSAQLDFLYEFDGVIIQYSSLQFTNRLVKNIHLHPDLFLKPLFIHYNFSGLPSSFMIKNTDGLITDIRNTDALLIKSSQIHEKINKLLNSHYNFIGEFRLVKFLSYLYTRTIHEILPVHDGASATGYSYPFVNDFDTDTDGLSKYALLREAEQEGFLQGTFHDYVHLCPNCTHSHMIYREVCAKCHSSHLEEENLIHHFRCATIKPEKDFKRLNSQVMTCPKCDHALRHIGVDYDKPSSMYHCQKCHHQSQQVQIWAKCCNCEKDTPVEFLLKQEVKKYKVTDKSIESLIQGQSMGHRKSLKENSLVMSLSAFSILLKDKIENKLAGEHCLSMIEFNMFQDVENFFGKQTINKFWFEIFQIIKPALGHYDEIALDHDKFYFTLYETEFTRATRITEQLTYLIQNLIEVNFKINTERIRFNTIKLDNSKNIEENLQKLHV